MLSQRELSLGFVPLREMTGTFMTETLPGQLVQNGITN